MEVYAQVISVLVLSSVMKWSRKCLGKTPPDIIYNPVTDFGFSFAFFA